TESAWLSLRSAAVHSSNGEPVRGCNHRYPRPSSAFAEWLAAAGSANHALWRAATSGEHNRPKPVHSFSKRIVPKSNRRFGFVGESLGYSFWPLLNQWVIRREVGSPDSRCGGRKLAASSRPGFSAPAG